MIRIVTTACRDRGDRGAATAFVVGIALALLVAAGFVLDGGQAINARARVADDAEQAARAAADRVDVATLRGGGTLTLDAASASGAAQAFLAARGYAPSQIAVAVAGDTATVTLTDTVPTAFVLIVGITEFPVGATATASALTEVRP